MLDQDSTKSMLAAWAVVEYKNFLQKKADRMEPRELIDYLVFFVSDCEKRNCLAFGYVSAKALIEKVKYDVEKRKDSTISWVGRGS